MNILYLLNLGIIAEGSNSQNEEQAREERLNQSYQATAEIIFNEWLPSIGDEELTEANISAIKEAIFNALKYNTSQGLRPDVKVFVDKILETLPEAEADKASFFDTTPEEQLRAFVAWDEVKKWDETRDKTPFQKAVDGFFSFTEKVDDILSGRAMVEGYLDTFERLGYLSADSKNNIMALLENQSIGGGLLAAAMPILFMFNLIKSLMSASDIDIMKNLNAIFVPGIITPDLIQKLKWRAPLNNEVWDKLMNQNSLGKTQIGYYDMATRPLLSEEQIKTLFFRGHVTEVGAISALKSMGYVEPDAKNIIKTWTVLPGVSDILYMLGKEAFEPDQIKELGLDAEYPAEASTFAKQQGLSDDWMKKYWYAHWQLPSIEMGFEMLHRGVIDQTQLNALFKAQEIPPFWRDKLTRISYHTFTRVDTRRMHDLGLISRDEVKRSYMNEGYNDIDAEKMTMFTLDYNENNDKDISRAQVEEGLKYGLISESEARAFLSRLGYDSEQVDYIYSVVETRLELDHVKAVTSAIESAYKQYLVDENQISTELSRLGVTSQKIADYIGLWSLQRSKSQKKLTITEITQFAEKGMLDETQAREQLRIAGYSPSNIELWIEYYRLVREV